MSTTDKSGSILVTGAAGFIGSHVTEALLKAGHRVIGLDNFDAFYPREAKARNLAEATSAHAGRFELVEGDITDVRAMGDLFTKTRPAGVIHLAAKAGVRPSLVDPAGYMHTNAVGTASILQAASGAGCSRVVVASSSSVYGNAPSVPFHEDLDVSRPISPYAASKRATEIAAWTHHHLTGLPISCLRFFTVYGPRQRPDLAISQFLRRISAGETIRMFGDGTTSRDYTFIGDIVRGILSAYERTPEHGSRVWNLGNSHPVSLREMISTIERVVGKQASIVREEMQPGDVERTYADVSRSGRELGFVPSTAFEDGVRAQWEWLRRL